MCADLAHAFGYEFANPCAEPVIAVFLMLPTRCRPSPARCRHGGAHAATAPFAFTRRNRATRSVQPASIPPSRSARHHDQRAGHPIAIALPPPTHSPHGATGYPLPVLSSHASLNPAGPHTKQSRRPTPGQVMSRQGCIVTARSPGDTPPMLQWHCMCPMLRALARLAFRSSRACGVHAASLQRVRTCTPW